MALGCAPSEIAYQAQWWRRSWKTAGAHARLRQRGLPDPASEVAVAHRRSLGGGEHERLGVGLTRRERSQLVGDESRDRHGAPRCSGLHVGELPVTVELLDDAQPTGEQINALPAEPQRLPDTQAAVPTDQDERPVAGVDGVGDGLDLLGQQHPLLRASGGRELGPDDRVRRDEPVRHGQRAHLMHDEAGRADEAAAVPFGLETGDPRSNVGRSDVADGAFAERPSHVRRADRFVEAEACSVEAPPASGRGRRTRPPRTWPCQHRGRATPRDAGRSRSLPSVASRRRG